MSREHTSSHYERRLRLLKDKLLLMGYQAEQMIADSMRSLQERRLGLAEEVISRDDTLDQLEIEIDTLCYEVLALEQPVASDLRFVATALKIVRDIERIGDIAVNITRRTVELLLEPRLKRLIALPLMAEASQKILKDSLDAFIGSDAQLAERVIQSDRNIDEMYDEIFRELLAYMFEDPRSVSRTLKLIFIAKHLERVGDHSSNIAEMVIFMVKGKDIRHGRMFKPKKRILFVCTANSVRSQMAEAIFKFMAGDRYDVFSAGTNPTELHPRTIEVMDELNIDVRGHKSKSVDLFTKDRFNFVITVCNRAKQDCSIFTGSETIHWEIEDPADVAEEGQLAAFRRTRDEIVDRIRQFLTPDSQNLPTDSVSLRLLKLRGSSRV
jgi:phosphate transport system protein